MVEWIHKILSQVERERDEQDIAELFSHKRRPMNHEHFLQLFLLFQVLFSFPAIFETPGWIVPIVSSAALTKCDTTLSTVLDFKATVQIFLAQHATKSSITIMSKSGIKATTATSIVPLGHPLFSQHQIT